MRTELYKAIRERLSAEVPEVKHVDLWNHNVEFIEQEDGWARPAVFVELGPIKWSHYVGGGRRGQGSVRLHLVTDWNEGGQEAAFELSDKVCMVLNGMSGEQYDSLYLEETVTNHNHEDLLESIDSYGVRFLRD